MKQDSDGSTRGSIVWNDRTATHVLSVNRQQGHSSLEWQKDDIQPVHPPKTPTVQRQLEKKTLKRTTLQSSESRKHDATTGCHDEERTTTGVHSVVWTASMPGVVMARQRQDKQQSVDCTDTFGHDCTDSTVADTQVVDHRFSMPSKVSHLHSALHSADTRSIFIAARSVVFAFRCC